MLSLLLTFCMDSRLRGNDGLKPTLKETAEATAPTIGSDT
jgi:hypothetical protein